MNTNQKTTQISGRRRFLDSLRAARTLGRTTAVRPQFGSYDAYLQQHRSRD